jgi:Transposase IS4
MGGSKSSPKVSNHGVLQCLVPDDDASDATINPTTPPFNVPAVNVPGDTVNHDDSVSELNGPTNDGTESTGDEEDNEEEPDLPAFSNAYNWFAVKNPTDDDVNGDIPSMPWKFLGTDGSYWEPNDDPTGTKRPLLEYFLACMPPATIKRILKETNKKLTMHESSLLDIAELLRFFGICILVTRFEFESRRDLWSVNTSTKFIPPANFALTGMSRNRFEEIWSLMTFSCQPPVRPDNMSTQDYRWMLVDDFVTDYNKHRRVRFRPK